MNDEPEQAGAPAPSPFAQIRHETDDGGEYWSARELGQLLGYTEYGKFVNAIRKAELACQMSGQEVSDHFAHVREMVSIGSGAQRKVNDVRLSRYGAYLAVENADPQKEIVALGQTYFAAQTHRQEQVEAFQQLSEDERRLYLRQQLADHNRLLATTAMGAGVIHPLDFAIFQDHGYRGLYGGLGARDIHARKGLTPNQGILDHMGSTELAANLFRATQTEEKMHREGVTGKAAANATHYEVGRKVRQTMAELGTPMPEDLPTPTESVQQLQQRERRRLKRPAQPPLLPEETEHNPDE
jgi:DNA-damage-inducible protein D